jgi:hypothetical protein
MTSSSEIWSGGQQIYRCCLSLFLSIIYISEMWSRGQDLSLSLKKAFEERKQQNSPLPWNVKIHIFTFLVLHVQRSKTALGTQWRQREICVGARETAEAQQHAAGKRRQAHAKELGLRETPPLWRKRLHSQRKTGSIEVPFHVSFQVSTAQLASHLPKRGYMWVSSGCQYLTLCITPEAVELNFLFQISRPRF